MSAKKRGPGRPPKSKNKKKPVASAPARNTHTVPSHFWSQVGAIILAVVTAMLVAGLFGMGGELPVGFANAVRWLVGWTAFVIPVVFAVQIIQVSHTGGHLGNHGYISSAVCGYFPAGSAGPDVA